MIGTRDRIVEDDHDAVRKDPLQRAFISEDELPHALVIFSQQRHDLFRLGRRKDPQGDNRSLGASLGLMSLSRRKPHLGHNVPLGAKPLLFAPAYPEVVALGVSPRTLVRTQGAACPHRTLRRTERQLATLTSTSQPAS
jgi:hypothetical protein